MELKHKKRQEWWILRFIKKSNMLLWYVIATFLSLGLMVKSVLPAYDGTADPEMTTQTWPAGTFLANFPEGDRINTDHHSSSNHPLKRKNIALSVPSPLTVVTDLEFTANATDSHGNSSGYHLDFGDGSSKT